MKASERFLSKLLSVTDDRTMEHLAIRLDPLLTNVDGAVYHLGAWHYEEDDMTSMDGDAVIDSPTVRCFMSKGLRSPVHDIIPVHLRDLNRPFLHLPWMTKEANLQTSNGAVTDAMALMAAKSIGKPFDQALSLCWSGPLQEELRATQPAIDALIEGLRPSLAVRFSSGANIAFGSGATMTLAEFVLANLVGTVHLFTAAALADHGKALLAIGPIIDMFDSCIPLGMKDGVDGTVLLLVE